MKMLTFSLFLINLSVGYSNNVHAHNLNLIYEKNVKSVDKKILESAMEDVASLLPESFKNKLPSNIKINIEKLSNHTEIPEDICETDSTTPEETNNTIKSYFLKKKSFVYGSYKQLGNTLTINSIVLKILAIGKEKSKTISCQHKSLYDQAIATIIHELTHAYDFHNKRISKSMEFLRKAGFKRGLLRIKNKNVHAMRSPDLYELVNSAESFAVNMEYFTMDPEFMCRKPSMFEFYKELFGIDPFPARKCVVNNMIMVSSNSGHTPTELLAPRVYRIDYLLASAGKGISSGFGHTMFRIIICAPKRFDPILNKTIPETPFGEKCLEDKLYHLVVSYRANIEDGKINFIKGLTGAYPSMLFLLKFSDVIDEYNRDELRDLISYPLKLSAQEREDFITKVKEEHWNYRGAYKFISNNCAVESYDLLKSALSSDTSLQQKSSLTPNGVLEDLDQLNFLSENDGAIETFNANTNQIILAYNKAYDFKLKKKSKSNKDAVLKFIDESTTEQRILKFTQFINEKKTFSNLKAELTFLKERLIKASSYSVMEQQILNSLFLKYRKKVADMFMDTKNEKVMAFIKDSGDALNHKFTDLSEFGYGIPLKEEMITNDDLLKIEKDALEISKRSEVFLKDIFPNELEVIEEIKNNIIEFNKYSLSIRKIYRSKLEVYITFALKKLVLDNSKKEMMIKAASSDPASLKQVREIIGNDLVTEKEILDSKLVKLINELIY